MLTLWSLSLLVILVFPAVLTNNLARSRQPYKIVCYLGSWANYRHGDGKFLIEDIDPSLCTHLVYGFAKLGHDNRIAAFDPYLDLRENWGLGAYERFTGLKDRKAGLKALLAIGGWNEGSTKYSRMAKSPMTRSVFIQSCVDFLLRYNFDGLDLDWEYPSTRGGSTEDKNNFVLLLKELKEAFRSHNLLLTAAVSAGQNTIDLAYDVPALAKYLDLINLMAYDFHGGWDSRTGHNSPLYPRPTETDDQKKLNVDYAVRYWLSKGAPPEKLILGMPLYGRSFTLQDPQRNGLDQAISGKGMAGEYTREQGFLGYNEICKKLQTEKEWKTVTEKHVNAPYIVKDRQWIGYDDVKSITAKVDYLVKMKLGGGMVWSLETDDFRGKCHGYRYPLLQAINAVLNGTSLPQPDYNIDQDNGLFPTSWSYDSSSSRAPPSWIHPSTPSRAAFPWTTRFTTVSRTTLVTTQYPDGSSLYCSRSGYFRHPKSCKFFYLCQPKRPGFDGGFQIYLFTCGAGTVFSEEMRTCAHLVDVPGCTES